MKIDLYSSPYHFIAARILAVIPATGNRNLLSHANSSATRNAAGARGKIAMVLAHLLRVRRLRCGIAVQIAIEPIQLPVQTLHQMLRFARPGEIVVLSRKEDDL